MDKLTKFEKIEGYEYALKHIDTKGVPIYICAHLSQYLRRKTSYIRTMSVNDCVEIYFPEFWKRKTVYGYTNVGWWPLDTAGILRRKEVLHEILIKLK